VTAESSPLQLSLGVDAPHNNRSLFSDHFLAYLLPQDGRWEAGLVLPTTGHGTVRELVVPLGQYRIVIRM
jgi:hypothetical protein